MTVALINPCKSYLKLIDSYSRRLDDYNQEAVKKHLDFDHCQPDKKATSIGEKYLFHLKSLTKLTKTSENIMNNAK